jgi:hypothetical protein
MNWQAIFTKLVAGEAATWEEYELVSERKVRFTVEETKWSHVVGRYVVKARLERAKKPEHDGMMPAGYIGSATFAIEDGRHGYVTARVQAMTEAYNTRKAVEKGY